MMNILYLHGLESKLSSQKREILENYGNVFAPDLGYHEDSNAIANVLEQFNGSEINVVMGSSMGGFAGYYVAKALGCPALLFNPALRKRSVKQNIPEDKGDSHKLKQFVIGQSDDVVLPGDSLNFISENLKGTADLYLHLVPQLGHRIPLDIFETEVHSFFEKIT